MATSYPVFNRWDRAVDKNPPFLFFLVYELAWIPGALLLLLSQNLDDWLGSDDGTRKPKLDYLIVVFFAIIFLSATQDIVLHGWALSMLHK